MSVSVQTSPAFELGTPEVLLQLPNIAPFGISSTFDAHPDGERFVVVRSVGGETSGSQINVVLNWLQELTGRVPLN